MMMQPHQHQPKLQHHCPRHHHHHRRRWSIGIIMTMMNRLQQCLTYVVRFVRRCCNGSCCVVPNSVAIPPRSMIIWITMVLLMMMMMMIIIILIYLQSMNHIRQVSFLSHHHSPFDYSSMFGNNNNIVIHKPYTCAPWLTTKQQRTVAFLDLSDMDNYYNRQKKMYRGGEFYMSAALDYALRNNGFIVQRIGMKSIQQLLQQEKKKKKTTTTTTTAIFDKYHRIFANGYDPWMQLLLLNHNKNNNNKSSSSSTTTTTFVVPPEQVCKLRSIHWWGNTNEHYISSSLMSSSSSSSSSNNRNNTATTIPTSIDDLLPMFHHSQWMKPYPTANDDYNTFIGYTPHSKILYPTYDNTNNVQPTVKNQKFMNNNNNKVGLLFGKVSKSFRHATTLIQALIRDGFVLHTTCIDCSSIDVLPIEVIRHVNIGPLEYIQLLQDPDLSFLIGFGYPYDSPSPIEALANGVAFINPIANHYHHHHHHHDGTGPSWFDPTTTTLRATQHVPIQHLGSPYVYNVHLNNIQQVLDAANTAVQYRFHSYIPVEYHPISLIARVCTLLLEDDSICTCPNHNKNHHHDDSRIMSQIQPRSNQYHYNDNNNYYNPMDCRSGSNTIRKSTTGNDANGVGNISFY